MRRQIIAMALSLVAVDARADDPSQQAQLDLATGLEQANAQRWEDALASLDRVVAEDPTWSEGYFVRAGVAANLAGDASTIEAMAKLDRAIDYARIAAMLDRSVADLQKYLELEPDAENAGQVIAAAAALRARSVIAHEHESTVARLIAAEEDVRLAAADLRADAFARPFAMADLTHARRVTVDASLAAVDVGIDGESMVLFGVTPAATWAIDAAFGVHGRLPVALGSSTDDTVQSAGPLLGDLAVGGDWVHDLRVGARHVRVGVAATIAVPTATGDALEFAQLDQGVTSPIAFAPGWGAELATAARLAGERAFAQAELAGDLVEYDGTVLAARLGIGGGVRLARGYVGLATFTTVVDSADTPWTGTSTMVHELRIGAAGPRVGAALIVPISGPVASQRGIAITATFTLLRR